MPASQPVAAAPLPQRAPSPTRIIVWKIDSEPADAEVRREGDGALLCRTPCVHEQTSGSGRVRLRLKRSGFLDRIVSLAADEDAGRTETLDPIPKSHVPPTTKPAAAKSVKPALPPSKQPAVVPVSIPPRKPEHARPKIED